MRYFVLYSLHLKQMPIWLGLSAANWQWWWYIVGASLTQMRQQTVPVPDTVRSSADDIILAEHQLRSHSAFNFDKTPEWRLCLLSWPTPVQFVRLSFVVHHKLSGSYVSRTTWPRITKFYPDMHTDLVYTGTKYDFTTTSGRQLSKKKHRKCRVRRLRV